MHEKTINRMSDMSLNKAQEAKQNEFSTKCTDVKEHPARRDAYVDVAKGIAMLLVVRIHTEVFVFLHTPYPIIAVPLFFFLSGFYDNTGKSLRQWFPKTFRSLFVTRVIWALISFLYVSSLHYVRERTFSVERLLEIVWSGGGVMWFLFALFWAKCGMWLVRKFSWPFYVVLPVLLIVSVFLSGVNLPLLMDEGVAALPFYYLGNLLYPYVKRNCGRLSLLAFLGLLCLCLMPMSWFPFVLVPWGGGLPIFLYPICLVMTVLSFFPVLWLSNRLVSQTWLANYGTQTLGILLLHPLMLHTCAVVLNRLFMPGSFAWIIIFLCAYFLVCIACYWCSVWISRNVPFLLGKKH